jgi:signal transduction histidine kinase
MNNTRQKSGSGLGLSIVKDLVAKMNGTVSFESRPGLTRFIVELEGTSA